MWFRPSRGEIGAGCGRLQAIASLRLTHRSVKQNDSVVASGNFRSLKDGGAAAAGQYPCAIRVRPEVRIMNTLHPHLMARLAALAASAATTFALLSCVVSLADPGTPARSAGFTTQSPEQGQPLGAASPGPIKEAAASQPGTRDATKVARGPCAQCATFDAVRASAPRPHLLSGSGHHTRTRYPHVDRPLPHEHPHWRTA